MEWLCFVGEGGGLEGGAPAGQAGQVAWAGRARSVKAALLVEPWQGWQLGQAGHAGCSPGRAEQCKQDR